MSTATVNSRPRKQLGDQLDRLDGIIDVLAEGLNGAVAEAAREGVHLAVKDAVIELMTDPTLRARLHEATAPEATPEPTPTNKRGWWAPFKAKAGQVLRAMGRTASHLVDGAVSSVKRIGASVAEGIRSLQNLGSLKTLALVGIGVGVAVGAASFLAPHAAAATLCGVSSAVAATAAQVGIWTRRAFRGLTMA